jgi:hypothetical protein
VHGHDLIIGRAARRDEQHVVAIEQVQGANE